MSIDKSRTFTSSECEILQFALLQSYKILKDYEDEWHIEQLRKVKDLLVNKFQINVGDLS